jgi:hypothetical protein
MIHVTRHAADRYLERVNGGLTLAEAIEALSSPVIVKAADFGASYVRLAAGQRVVLEGHTVTTVLPAENYRRQVARQGVGRFGGRHRAEEGQ